MKHLTKWAVLPLALLAAAAQAEISVDEAQATVDEFKKRDPDLGALFLSSAGYVVFPEVKKGGFVFGGAGGEGVLFEKGVPVGTVKMTQVSVGAQVGGKTYSEIVFLQDKPALYRFKRGESSLSAHAGANLAGEERKAPPQYDNGMLVFTKAISGIMADASVGGQKFAYTPFAKGKPGT
jgi:lipid-binding SYLF domain-containing protein